MLRCKIKSVGVLWLMGTRLDLENLQSVGTIVQFVLKSRFNLPFYPCFHSPLVKLSQGGLLHEIMYEQKQDWIQSADDYKVCFLLFERKIANNLSDPDLFLKETARELIEELKKIRHLESWLKETQEAVAGSDWTEILCCQNPNCPKIEVDLS